MSGRNGPNLEETAMSYIAADESEARPLGDPRYPIGKFLPLEQMSDADRSTAIAAIEALPSELRGAVAGLTDAQLATPYREGGWTVRQVMHHVPDSHLNAYTRFKLTLTESNPTIRTYDEASWATLADATAARVEASLILLDGLHERWVMLLRSMETRDFARTLQHPEVGAMNLNTLLGMYGWHGRHHVAHITELRKRMNW